VSAMSCGALTRRSLGRFGRHCEKLKFLNSDNELGPFWREIT
jgi:hypothetical protein